METINKICDTAEFAFDWAVLHFAAIMTFIGELIEAHDEGAFTMLGIKRTCSIAWNRAKYRVIEDWNREFAR